jgi:hypothetical protein
VQAHRNVKAVSEAADGVFDQLWEEIKEVCLAGKNRGMNLDTNGSPLSRVVLMLATHGQSNARSENDRKLTISLSADRRSILAASDSGENEMKIEVCPDGVVCLKFQAHKVSSRDAAKIIMEPFLFSGQSPYSSRV